MRFSIIVGPDDPTHEFHPERSSMRILRSIAVIVAFAVFATSRLHTEESAQSPGPLFIVGGGSIADELRKEVIGLAGGEQARVAIFGQASKDENAGKEIAEVFEKCGAGRVDVVDLSGKEKAEGIIAKATLIWFGGGSQQRLVDELGKARLIEPILARWREGAVVGGTSAGAAVMSAKMIDGDDYDLKKIESGKTTLGTGLAFLPDTIVDQHFVKRNRFTRLLTAVLDNPDLIGIGIDESTAAVVVGSRLRVTGASHVLVIDARKAVYPEKLDQALPAAEDVKVHVLRPGMELDLAPR
jgi:cyanophycinase